MVNGIRENDPWGLNKGHDLKFCVGSRVQQETSEEGRRIFQLKHCEYNNKDEDNSPKTLNDKNHQVSSQKFTLGEHAIDWEKILSIWRTYYQLGEYVYQLGEHLIVWKDFLSSEWTWYQLGEHLIVWKDFLSSGWTWYQFREHPIMWKEFLLHFYDLFLSHIHIIKTAVIMLQNKL